MGAVPTFQWFLAAFFLVASAFCSGTETALTALGDARARRLRDGGSRRGRMLSLWIEHPERLLSTLLIVNTLVNVGAGALAAAIATEMAAGTGWNLATTVAATTAVATVVILFFGEIVPKTLGKRHPARMSLATIPAARLLATLLWPVSITVTRATSALVRLFGGSAGPAPLGDERGHRVPHRDGHEGGRPRRGEGGAPEQRARVRRPGRARDDGPPHPDGRHREARHARRALPVRDGEPVQPHARVRGVGRQRRRHPARARDHRRGAPRPGAAHRPRPVSSRSRSSSRSR